MAVEQTALSLGSEIQYLPGVGPERASRLRRLGLRTAQDALFFFPRDYERPAPPTEVSELREGREASIVGTITDAELVSRTPGKSVFAAIVENETGAVRIVFFNQPFRAEQIVLGQRVQISGAPKLKGLRMEFIHPKATPLGEEETFKSPGILPIYPLTEGLRQTDLRGLTRSVVPLLAEKLTEVLPDSLRCDAARRLSAAGLTSAASLPPIDQTLRQIHEPADESQLEAARLRLIFQEFLVMQLALAIRRRQLTTELRAPPLAPSAVIDARILNRFPFELTGDQRQAIREIGRDMSRQFPMNRLLQGDVGSGKTVVAVYAMMLAVAHRHQAALMAPTEILARQHYETLTDLLAGSRVRLGLLCGSLPLTERNRVREATAAGAIDVLVGTHSLASAELEFCRLGLCVIDEQHKFGVRQRVGLRSGGVDPHYLVMSATPIPRSIAMTLFGDVELSTLRETPPGRSPVHTYLARNGWKQRWWKFVRERLDEGRQAYVVAPRIRSDRVDDRHTDEVAAGVDDGFVEDAASVERIYDELRDRHLSGYRVGLLHGRMSADQKQSVMRSFADGGIQVLVSTTVVEVGVDVPNATVMTVLGAERFGLAQLHQLRGRVCRGSHAGHVCVFTDGEGSPEESERLRVLEQTRDGFELAEADFRLRGPGELLGNRQSGVPPLRVADLARDTGILAVARETAQSMIDADPRLEATELAELRRQVLRRYEKRLDLGDVA